MGTTLSCCCGKRKKRRDEASKIEEGRNRVTMAKKKRIPGTPPLERKKASRGQKKVLAIRAKRRKNLILSGGMDPKGRRESRESGGKKEEKARLPVLFARGPKKYCDGKNGFFAVETRKGPTRKGEKWYSLSWFRGTW